LEQTNKRSGCASFVKVIASIEDPEVIRKILAHLDKKVTPTGTGMLPETRAPPATGLFA
jgi:hypothetical protein